MAKTENYTDAGKNLSLILLVYGFIYLRSSYGKITEGKFVDSLGATLTKFADKNPYPWFKQFLVSTAIPNSQIFGLLTELGEFATALTVVVGSLMLIFNWGSRQLASSLLAGGLIVGMFLNAVFWLASGWTSPSTDGLNLLMFFVGLFGLLTVSKSIPAK